MRVDCGSSKLYLVCVHVRLVGIWYSHYCLHVFEMQCKIGYIFVGLVRNVRFDTDRLVLGSIFEGPELPVVDIAYR